MKICEEQNKIIVTGVSDFLLSETLLCGQCFRFREENGIFKGAIGKHICRVSQEGDSLIFYGTEKEVVEKVFIPFFDLDADYSYLRDLYSKDETLKKAMDFCFGIRILRQDAFEALITFIISQNNNIKRIGGIVERFCQMFGEHLGEGIYSFPTPEMLRDVTIEELSPLRAGFRDKYLLDAFGKVLSGDVDLKAIKKMPTEKAIEELMKIKGVGLKVASCVALFGLYKTDAFPIDVWIKRVLETYYPSGFPLEFYETRGIAQQFLFHYIRFLEERE
jgi:N-glycosylase/DNA lyase